MAHTAIKPFLGKDQPSLSALLEKALMTVKGLGVEFYPGYNRLTDLKNRLSEGRFHLAVLGQFKRGKSTLLNALVGDPILPVGVVPLTAVPAFIRFGEAPKIRIHFQDNRITEEFTGTATHQRTAYLARFVTEESNPQNKRGVAEVEVILPAPILADGVVLIDTPGIGSTYRHNTITTLNFLEQEEPARKAAQNPLKPAFSRPGPNRSLSFLSSNR